MNQQPNQQQPSSQSQGSQQTPPRSHKPRPKNSRKMSTGVKAALIGAGGVILAAIISGIFTLHPFPPHPPNPNLNPTATSHPSPNVYPPYPPIGWKLALNDSMKNNVGIWDEGTTSDGSCKFTTGVYHVTVSKQNTYYQCIAEGTDFTNFALEAEVTIVKGDLGGISFRYNASTASQYFFLISQTGGYELDTFENHGSFTQTLVHGTDPAIHTGLNQSNLIAVVAQENTFALYVNKQRLNLSPGIDKDNSLTHGQIGLMTIAHSDPTDDPTEVLFSSVKIWTPPSS